jgi:hypothetical protein
MTTIATLRSTPARLVRRVLAGTVGRLGPVQHRVTMWISGLQRSPLRHELPAVTRRPADAPAAGSHWRVTRKARPPASAGLRGYGRGRLLRHDVAAAWQAP